MEVLVQSLQNLAIRFPSEIHRIRELMMMLDNFDVYPPERQKLVLAKVKAYLNEKAKALIKRG